MFSYPDMVSDTADGYNCVSGQKEVFSYFFSESHGTKRIQITENHLPLCTVIFTYGQTFLQKDKNYTLFFISK